MLRGLLIRQGLLLLHMILAILIDDVLGLVILEVFEEQERIVAGDVKKDSPGLAGWTPQPIKERGAYDRIVEAGLFGIAGATAPSVDASPPPAEEEPVETDLPLHLYGTAAAFPTDPLGTAVIQDDTTKLKHTYYLGQEVKDNRVLMEIHKRKVVLQNRLTSQKEVLLAEEASGQAEPATVARANVLRPGVPLPAGRPGPVPQPPTGVARPDGNRILIDRNELAQEFSQVNYSELYAQISPEIATDQRGNVLGLTSKNIGNIPLAQKYGFKEGDIIQKINGQTINSEQAVVDVLTKYQTANTFWVSVLRDGRPQTLVFQVK